VVPWILRLDKSGRVIGWMTWQEAAVLYTKDLVAWTYGENVYRIYGGVNRAKGRRSYLDLHSIAAVKGPYHANRVQVTPPLNNRELFRRDQHLCMYCLKPFSDQQLTRDHVVPLALNGRNTWTNVVTACLRCNQRKGARTPEQANMPLHAVPYKPNYAEWLVLRNRRILADQMAFLSAQFKNYCV
jgi:5-methylcytosine-specific restriction endonuclease McrA